VRLAGMLDVAVSVRLGWSARAGRRRFDARINGEDVRTAGKPDYVLAEQWRLPSTASVRTTGRRGLRSG